MNQLANNIEHEQLMCRVPNPIQAGAVLYLAEPSMLGSDVLHDQNHEEFSGAALLDEVKDELQARADGFDELLAIGRYSAAKIISSAGDEVRTLAENGPAPHRRIDRFVARRFGGNRDTFLLAAISEARTSAAGLSNVNQQFFNKKNLNKARTTRGLPAVEYDNSSILEGLGCTLLASHIIVSEDESNLGINYDVRSAASAHKITDAEKTIWGALSGRAQTVEDMNSFISWVGEVINSGDEEAFSLLEMLAVDMVDPLSDHLVNAILERSLANSVEVLDRQCLEALFASDTDFAKELKLWSALLTGSKTEAIDKLIANKSLWDVKLLAAQAHHTAQLKTEMSATLTKLVGGYFYKYQQVPSPQRGLESAIASRLEGSGRSNIINTPSGKKNAHRGRVTPKSRVAVGESVVPADNTVKTIAVDDNPESLWAGNEDPQSLEAMIAVQVRQYPHEKKLESDLRRMIESIRTRPFGEGTIMHHGNIRLSDGTKVRRLSPTHQKGLPTSTSVAKDMRILFAVHRQPDSSKIIGILDIMRHARYENWLALYITE